MLNRLAWIAGKVCRPEDAKVSVFDRGFLFGDGVYETGRTYRRTFMFLEEHLTRLRRSAKKLEIPIPWTDDEITAGLVEVAKAFGKESLSFRTILTRGELTEVSLDQTSGLTPTLVHLVQDIDENALVTKRTRGIHLLTSKIVRNSAAALDPNIKSSNYLNSLLALQDVKARGGEDAILCDSQGRVTEGTTFSVFGVNTEGGLFTPAMDVGILDSISRRQVIAVAAPDIKVKEGYFTLADFMEAKEAFIASSVREIIPVREWDNTHYDPVPGSKTSELQTRFKKNISVYLKDRPQNY